MNNDTRLRDGEANSDPLSGAPGSHPVGTGVGAIVGGAAAGAATGTLAGPIGTVIGAAVGAIVGGLTGKGMAEAIDPTSEDAYGHSNSDGRTYLEQGSNLHDIGGVDGFGTGSLGGHDLAASDPMRAHASLPRPESMPPPPSRPPEVVPPPLDTPPQVAPEIREPDQPGNHLPIGDNPRHPTPMRY